MIKPVTVIVRDNLLRLALLITCVNILATTPAMAAASPRTLSADHRIDELNYVQDQVFQVHTQQGVATHIVLDPAEKIIASAAGMPADCNRQGSDWCIVALVGSNELFIKPRNPATASNNLQLTTNLRRYSFEFLNTHGAQTTPWFRVTFRYSPERPPEARSAGIASAITNKSGCVVAKSIKCELRNLQL